MKILLVFLPLLGLVAAQMNGHMNGQVATGQQNRDPFFNDFGPGTGSKPAAPWAAPPQQAGHGNFGSNTVHSPSSTKPPGHNPVPVGGPQVANNNPYANADPNAGGGNSGGLTGFGEADVFHAVLNGQQPLPAGGAGPVNGGNGQSSERLNPLYELVPGFQRQGMQHGGGGQAGMGIGMDPGRGGPVRASGETINPDYLGGAPGVPGGGYHGQLLPNGGGPGMGAVDPNTGMGPGYDTPDIPVETGDGVDIPVLVVNASAGGHPGMSSGETHPRFGVGLGKPNGGGDFYNLLSGQGDNDQAAPQGVSAGTVVGIATGVIIVAVVVGAIVFFVMKRRKHFGYLSSI